MAGHTLVKQDFPPPFGPVPSRRLGRSLGVNNIPPKICSYACVYCQVGRTLRMQVERMALYPPELVVAGVRKRVRQLREREERLDYVTIVSDGEPTLDANLGRVIRRVRHLGVRVAVITNASLIDRRDVQDDLAAADWVSLKVDAVDRRIWRRINRPHASLDLEAVMRGMLTFAAGYPGRLATETMLVRDLNDGEEHLRLVASFLGELQPDRAYLAVPVRPPAMSSVEPPTAAALARAYRILGDRLPSVEYLVGYEGNAFASTGDAREDLLSITAVHPMKREAVEDLLARSGEDWEVVRDLVRGGGLLETTYGGETFYVRRLAGSLLSDD